MQFFRLRPITWNFRTEEKNLWQQKALNHISLAVLKYIHIEGDKVASNECQQKSVEMKRKKKNPKLYMGYYSLLSAGDKMTKQPETQTTVKCVFGQVSQDPS